MAITVGIEESAAQSRTDNVRRGFCRLGTTCEPCKSPVIGRATTYRHEVTTRRLDGDVDLSPYVAETADRLHDQLAEVSSGIQSSLEDHIPELRGDTRVTELLGASVEGNVDPYSWPARPQCGGYANRESQRHRRALGRRQ